MIVFPSAASLRTISCRCCVSSRAERRGRLVHHDQLRVPRERAQDLDLLLLGGPQPPGRHRPRQVEARPTRRAPRSARLSRRFRMKPASRGSTPRKTFCATVRCGHDRRLLRDRGDLVLERLARRARTPPPRPSSSIRPPSAPVHARDDLAERRLAGPVLADERVDRALANRERHARERLDAAEVLGDVQELEVRAFARLPSCEARLYC